jgi:protein-S-isoprenylcysteine O-methyltransferase Ste14
MEASTSVWIRHPNRESATAKATKAAVILLLLTSAGLILIVTVGGWSNLQGAQFVAIAWILIYVLMAYYVARWNRGVLPVASALAILLAVLAAVSAPSWFERDKTGFDNPGLPPGILGLLCLLIIPVSLLLIAFAMRGFSQKWNVEVEVPRGHDDYDEPRRGAPRPITG